MIHLQGKHINKLPECSMGWHVEGSTRRTIVPYFGRRCLQPVEEALAGSGTVWEQLSDWGQWSLIGHCQKEMCCDKNASSERSEEREPGKMTPPHLTSPTLLN
ncbi:hypothetical protein AOLI_G00125810 [Acnodon oligacanthus]